MDTPLASLFERLPAVAYRLGADGQIELISGECLRLTGHAPADFVEPRAVALRDLIHPDDRESVLRAIDGALGARRDFDLGYRLRTAAGEERRVLERGRGVFASDGEIRAVEGLIIDVTTRADSLGLPDASDARYRRLLESVTDYICGVKVLDGRVVETTHGPGCVSVTGYTSQDYAADPFLWYAMVHEDDRSSVQEHAARALAGGTASLEHRIRHRDGSIRWVRNTPVPHLDAHGDVLSYDALIADITARKEAEAALRENERFLESVFASIQDGISVLDRELRIVRVNPAMERWYRHALPLAGRYCYQAYHGRGVACEVCPSRRCLASGRAERDLVPLTGPDGQTAGWLDLFAFPLTDAASGELRGVIEYVRDVSEARRAEAALKDTEEQLRQAHKMEAIGTLAGGVAHDFNNLLTAILGYADLVRRGLPTESTVSKRADELIRVASRAAGLTRKLLAFSRKQTVAPVAIDLNGVIADMREMLRRVIAEDIELAFAPAARLAPVLADPGQIEQVILNLVVNARDAMPQGGRLTVETSNVVLDDGYAARHVAVRPGPYVMLSVSDNGCGMDAETRSHLFEPFFTTKEPGKGTGLGLATVYGIVKQAGGNVWIYSEPGRGTTVKVYLPPAQELGGYDQAPLEVVDRVGSASGTILVVEDEGSIRELASDILHDCGYVVLTARDGWEAQAILRDHAGRIDLLLTDIVMPRMNGRELVEKALALRPELALLYMSGYTDEALLGRGVLTADAPFLQKPFTAEDLARKVREAIALGARKSATPKDGPP